MGITGTANWALAIKSGQTRIELCRIPFDWADAAGIRRIAEQMTEAEVMIETAINGALTLLPEPKANVTVYQQLVW